MTLAEARDRLGARVHYAGGPTEAFGRIVMVNDRYVFVRYDGETHVKATNPLDIEFTLSSLAQALRPKR